MTDSLIERAARAVWDILYPAGTSWDDWAAYCERTPEGFDGREQSRQIARAVLQAIREPDRDVLLAGINTVDNGEGNLHRRKWQAMIGAALSE